MAKTRRKTGQPQKTAQSFSIDRLPVGVREAIELLKNRYGKTWEQIEALSAEPFKAKLAPLGCFVDWGCLDADVLALFPNKRIPKSNLQRWYDVRVRQVKADVLHRSAQARELATAFASAGLEDGDDAVMNATRDVIMGMLAEDSSTEGREAAVRGLLQLAQVQIRAKTNLIRERKVAVDEKTLQAKLDEMKRKAAELVKDAESTDGSEPEMTREQVIGRVKDIYGVA